MSAFRFLCSACLLLFLISSMVPKSMSDPTYLYSVCPVKKVFAPNSKYQTNLNTLFQSLSSNATTSDGFFSSSVNNVVYGLFLCRADLNATACSNCVSTATTTDLPKKYCSNRKVAVIWYDECMVRYTNHPVSGKSELSPHLSLMNSANKTGSLTGFSELLQKTVNDVVDRAAKNRSGKKFATSEVNMPTPNGVKKTLYVMGQCTPDLNTSVCSDCLMKAVKNLPLSDGGRVLQPSCNIRYELYPFFQLSTALAPAPAPAILTPTAPTSKISPESGNAPTMSPGATTTSNSPVVQLPGKNAGHRGTRPPQLAISMGLGIYVVLNLYHRII